MIDRIKGGAADDLRRLLELIRESVPLAERVARQAWRTHRRLLDTNPAYEAILAGAVVELVRLRQARDLPAVVSTVGLAIYAVVARSGRPKGNSPRWYGGSDRF